MYKSALYLFPLPQKEEQLAFYSPYYGDLPSAAAHFFKMYVHLRFEDYALAFLKANYEINFAPSASVQTDHRYLLNASGTLSVWSYGETEPHCVFEGPWYAFVNQYGSQEPLYCFQMEAGTAECQIMTLSEVQRWVWCLREFPEGTKEVVKRAQKAFFLELQLRRIQEKK